MNEKKLNDELTIVGLILVLLYIVYYLVTYVNYSLHLESKVTQAQKTAIYLDKRLTQTELSLSATNTNLINIQSTLKNYEFLDKIKKDIDRNGLEPE